MKKRKMLLPMLCFLLFAKAIGISGEIEITQVLLQRLLRDLVADDFLLYHHIQHFPLERYELIVVENKDLFFVDDIPDYIKNYLRGGYRYEPHVYTQMVRYVKPGSVAVDIGAHIGNHTLAFSRLVGVSGTVYAFEPQVKLFTELMINMHLNDVNNVMFYRKALGETFKNVEMNPPQITNEGGVGLGKGGDPVEMIPLDALQLEDVSFIKIDVEGYEEKVLEGARETILRNKPVISLEILGGASREDPKVKEAVQERIQQLAQWGYRVVQLWHHDYLCLPID